jgi:hypothetical protein
MAGTAVILKDAGAGKVSAALGLLGLSPDCTHGQAREAYHTARRFIIQTHDPVEKEGKGKVAAIEDAIREIEADRGWDPHQLPADRKGGSNPLFFKDAFALYDKLNSGNYKSRAARAVQKWESFDQQRELFQTHADLLPPFFNALKDAVEKREEEAVPKRAEQDVWKGKLFTLNALTGGNAPTRLFVALERVQSALQNPNMSLPKEQWAAAQQVRGADKAFSTVRQDVLDSALKQWAHVPFLNYVGHAVLLTLCLVPAVLLNFRPLLREWRGMRAREKLSESAKIARQELAVIAHHSHFQPAQGPLDTKMPYAVLQDDILSPKPVSDFHPDTLRVVAAGYTNTIDRLRAEIEDAPYSVLFSAEDFIRLRVGDIRASQSLNTFQSAILGAASLDAEGTHCLVKRPHSELFKNLRKIYFDPAPLLEKAQTCQAELDGLPNIEAARAIDVFCNEVDLWRRERRQDKGFVSVVMEEVVEVARYYVNGSLQKAPGGGIRAARPKQAVGAGPNPKPVTP